MTETEDRTLWIFRITDFAFRLGFYEEYDRLLQDLDVRHFDTFTARSWLVASNWAKDKLPSRPAFQKRVIAHLRKFVDHKRIEKLVGIL